MPTARELSIQLEQKAKALPIGDLIKAKLIHSGDYEVVGPATFSIDATDPALVIQLTKTHRAEDAHPLAEAPTYTIGVDKFWIIELDEVGNDGGDGPAPVAPGRKTPTPKPKKAGSRGQSKRGAAEPLNEDDVPEIIKVTEKHLTPTIDALKQGQATMQADIKKLLDNLPTNTDASGQPTASARSDGLRDSHNRADPDAKPPDTQIAINAYQAIRHPPDQDPNGTQSGRALPGYFKLIDELSIARVCTGASRFFSPVHLLAGKRQEVTARLDTLLNDFANQRNRILQHIQAGVPTSAKGQTSQQQGDPAFKKFFGVAIDHKIEIYVDYIQRIHNGGWYPKSAEEWQPVLLAAVDLLAAFATEAVGLKAGALFVMTNFDTMQRRGEFDVNWLITGKRISTSSS